MNEKPTRGQYFFGILTTAFCIAMFLVPICAIMVHASARYEAERAWQETQRREQEKTDRVIRAYNKVMNNLEVDRQLKLLKVEIEMQKAELAAKQVSENSK